jgi:hypothetical protein
MTIMPGSHLPWALCDKRVYDFPYYFWDIIGSYRLWCICSHCVRALWNFFIKAVQRLHRDCMEIVQFQYSYRVISAASARRWCVTVQLLCHLWATLWLFCPHVNLKSCVFYTVTAPSRVEMVQCWSCCW